MSDVLRIRSVSGCSAILVAAGASAVAVAQSAPPQSSTGEIVVTAEKGYATQPDYVVQNADLGPLGRRPIADTPASVTVVPEDLIVNNQARTVNDTLRCLPSVEVRDQQGFEVSRPQSRGFQGSIVQDTRLDGLNVVGTTAIPAENLAGIQVLNGLSGALYGPQSPAGVFNYELKRPTLDPLFRAIGSFDSQGLWTGQIDASATAGPIGYRFNLVHGEGEGYVDGSHFNRTLISGDFDIHVDDRTVIEADASHYETRGYGLPGSIVYFGKTNILLPKAIDPTRQGYGQPYAGVDLNTDTGLAKLKHDFGAGWKLEIGGLYQNADRGLFGITNTLTDNVGDYTVTKNFTAVPRFTVASNTASLTGTLSLFGLANDVAIGTNGFVNGQYGARNSIAVALGTGNLADPTILPDKPTPADGGQYKSGRLFVQSIVAGDTVHFDERLALQGTLSTSFLSSKSWSKTGAVTSSDTENGVVSGTASLIYKPIEVVTLYATYSNSVEQGETAPAGTANANQILSPYRDRQYEAGVKYQVTPGFLLTAAGFRMTRPLATTDAATNIFAVVGTQRNWGGELFGQGAVLPSLSLFGGVTYIDARLVHSGVLATNDKRVVGVPKFKSDVSADFHPAFAGGFALTGTFHYESDRAATNLNNSFAPAYATVDLGARYNAAWFGHHETVRLNVINVGDKRYYSSIADGNIVGSPGANTAYSGAPRTVLASVEFDL
ncbi:TonB-dependent receptor [Sphingomonas oryzagri]|uniref:TonB-dependent receptor n=1 Tax=Sphingomonas oryzagri TaxID=3042314 RepID=A0ABT6MXJ1_9SPHN|nr:TonB-dependent receptor [Sphingomonas oryzagri]MDH7637770.1 TonB-dependent receptor [Sphingomonas oryzagri]